MSLFEELKRRNVFRVGVAYGIAGWVLLQVADLVLDAIEAPAWVLKALLLVVVLGFVVALIIAWAYEMTPEGIKKESEVDRSQSITGDTGRKLDRIIISFLAAAVVILLADRFINPQATDTSLSSDNVVATDTGESVVDEPVLRTPEKSIAVLPFNNLSDDASNEFFADGISEEILNALAKVQELKVAGRTSAFAFKGRNEDLREIGEALGVNHILEGSVRKAGNTVRVTAQLIQVSDGFHLWSDTYDRELTDIFAIQDEIANAILQELKTELIGGQSIVSERLDPEVYEKYLLAKQHIYTRNEPSLKSAVDLLRAATDADPEFASAWAELGIATLLLAEDTYGTIPREEALSISKLYLDKALAIEPDNAEALAGMGFNYANQPGGRSVVETAIPLLERALAINPAMIDASNWLQQAYAAVGRGSDAHRILEEMFNRDPLYKPGAGNLIFSYNRQGRIEAAERALERIRPFIRDESFLARVNANILTNSGRSGEALPIARRSYEMDPNDNVAYAAVAWAMSNLRMDEELLDLKAPFPFFKLQAMTRLGRHEEGLGYAQEWSDRLGDPGILIAFFHNTRQSERLVDFVGARWPDLASFESEFTANPGFGYWNMIHIAHAYRKVGNRSKFEQAMNFVRASHDHQISEGFTSNIFYAAEASYWILAGNTDRGLDQLNTAIIKGNHFPISSFSLNPEYDGILDDPRFRVLAERAHEKFNEQRVIAGLDPIEPEWPL